MKRYRFLDAGLAGDVYVPDSPNVSRGVAVYLYGFPGSIGEGPVTKFLLAEGFTVVQPQYPGTYDSAGIFSPGSAIEMLDRLEMIITNGTLRNCKNNQQISLPKAITVCVGHSFGCFVALRAARFLHDLQVLILAGPAIKYASGGAGCGLVEDGPSHIDYVRRSRPFTYRIADDKTWETLYSGGLDSYEHYEHARLKAVVGVVGSEDTYFKREQLKDVFPIAVRAAIGPRATIDFIAIDHVGHGPAGLFPNPELSALLRRSIPS